MSLTRSDLESRCLQQTILRLLADVPSVTVNLTGTIPIGCIGTAPTQNTGWMDDSA
ncbi:hypothetical protein WKK05_36435 (plasmid) [Nostoc sp. UHCC 0302]|uniref:hypothetical protein n=1 Tax=Nostoc sp. UHCC 0302 TaxID=3134896 RepID=UPI00311CA8F6